MSKNFLQERLINGFSRFGYSLTADDDIGVRNEFTKPDDALRFGVRLGEGAVTLYWTKSPEHDLVDSKALERMPDGMERKIFCGGRDEFWQAVENIIQGTF